MIIEIRPINIDDADDINEMRIMDGVRENIFGIFSERISKSEDFINELDENAHILVAVVEEMGTKKAVGMCGLHLNNSPRLRHSGAIGMLVHKDYQGKGIGKKLINKIIDLADNWLLLVRLELGVIVDNEIALHLYESVGFEIEGTKKYSVIRNGKYVDEYLMGRYNITSHF